MSADGNTLAVGAYGEDSNAVGINQNQLDNSAPSAGAVYIYTRSGATWSHQAYLKASNTGRDDQFGRSVALSADGNTLAVGALYEDSSSTEINNNADDNSASNAGAVYVFSRDGSAWSQDAYIKASNAGEGDRFGDAVSLSAGWEYARRPRPSRRQCGCYEPKQQLCFQLMGSLRVFANRRLVDSGGVPKGYKHRCG